MRYRTVLVSVILLATDALSLVISYCLAHAMRTVVLSSALHLLTPPMPLSTMAQRWYLLLVYFPALAYEGLYTKRLVDWEEMRRCFRAVMVATVTVVVLVFVLRYLELSRLVIAMAFLAAIVVVPVARALVRRLMVRAGLFTRTLVLVGHENNTKPFACELRRHAGLGYEVAAFVERRSPTEPIEQVLDRAAAAASDAVLTVFTDSFTPDEIGTVIRYAERQFTDLMLVPSAAPLRAHAVDVEQFGSTLVMKYRYNLLRPLNRYIKLTLEFVACFLLAIVLLPLMGVLAILVKATSPGPILFSQTRVGLKRRPFRCLKLRTMYVGAEAKLERILVNDPTARAEYSKYARITNDPRVTPVGRFLRRFSLDELPQLWNVLRGEMALVGPRPYMERELNQIGAALDTIVRVRPGMTGLWQVSGRSQLPFQERVALDEYYIRNWSLWMDFAILLKTGWVVVLGRGAV